MVPTQHDKTPESENQDRSGEPEQSSARDGWDNPAGEDIERAITGGAAQRRSGLWVIPSHSTVVFRINDTQISPGENLRMAVNNSQTLRIMAG
jgi:hypothetical protein